MTEPKKPSPSEALTKLKDGNQRYVAGSSGGTIEDAPRRQELSGSQHPFAVVVGCSDSRVPVERVFGVGCGDIFVVRNAGNCIDTAALGSVQFAVAELGASVVVVMGHTKCGAVKAAASIVSDNAKFPGVLGPMLEPIVPAVLGVKGQPGDVIDNAVNENARRMADRLRADPILSQSLGDGLEIVPAKYDIDSGKVQFLDDKPLVA